MGMQCILSAADIQTMLNALAAAWRGCEAFPADGALREALDQSALAYRTLYYRLENADEIMGECHD